MVLGQLRDACCVVILPRCYASCAGLRRKKPRRRPGSRFAARARWSPLLSDEACVSSPVKMRMLLPRVSAYATGGASSIFCVRQTGRALAWGCGAAAAALRPTVPSRLPPDSHGTRRVVLSGDGILARSPNKSGPALASRATPFPNRSVQSRRVSE